jgi:hypothetical protein
MCIFYCHKDSKIQSSTAGDPLQKIKYQNILPLIATQANCIPFSTLQIQQVKGIYQLKEISPDYIDPLLTSCFTVAKVVRDRHEADKFITKVENAKTEKFLNENGSVLSGI